MATAHQVFRMKDLLSIKEKKTEQQKEGKEVITHQQQSPVYSLMYALKSSEARRQYPKRLKMLFDFLDLHGSLVILALLSPWCNIIKNVYLFMKQSR